MMPAQEELEDNRRRLTRAESDPFFRMTYGTDIWQNDVIREVDGRGSISLNYF